MYKVNVGGENFIIHLQGKPRRINFVSSYYLTAPTREAAEYQALGQLKEELENKVLNELEDPPEMYIQSVEKVDTIRENAPREFYWNEINENNNHPHV